MITTAPLAELVEDMSVYPRHTVDPLHVSGLADALRSGQQFPPVVIDAVSKRIVDGWHRVRAYRRILGETAAVSVEKRDYASEADMLLDAIAMNSAHGRRLDRADQVRAILLAERAGATVQAISVVLHVPEQKVEKLRVRVAEAPRAMEGTVTGGTEVVLKRPAFHMAGRTLTKEQVEAHESMPGTSLLLVAKQLRLALAAGFVDPGDENLHKELRSLARALGVWLQDRKKAA